MNTIYKSHNDSFSVKKRAGRGTSLLFLFLLSLLPLHAQTSPKHEVRAAWITAVYGLDWPRTKATTPAGIRRQKEELIDILDRLKEANFNTVLFQTRTRGDVLYRSDIEPFNSILTGKVGAIPDTTLWPSPSKSATNGVWSSCLDGDHPTWRQETRSLTRQTIGNQTPAGHLRAL